MLYVHIEFNHKPSCEATDAEIRVDRIANLDEGIFASCFCTRCNKQFNFMGEFVIDEMTNEGPFKKTKT